MIIRMAKAQLHSNLRGKWENLPDLVHKLVSQRYMMDPVLKWILTVKSNHSIPSTKLKETGRWCLLRVACQSLIRQRASPAVPKQSLLNQIHHKPRIFGKNTKMRKLSCLRLILSMLSSSMRILRKNNRTAAGGSDNASQPLFCSGGVAAAVPSRTG